MAHLYKEPKFCECGYNTRNRGAFSTHRSRHCPLRDQSSDVSDQDIHSRIRLLEQRLEVKDQQLAEQKQQLKQQFAEQKEQMKELLAAKDKQIIELIKGLDAPKAQKTAKRKKLSEPERRKIAIKQDWNCANPDGKCTLKGKLQEYDIDHIKPLCQGGQDDPSNFQAICPACHRRKTERDLSPGAAAEPAEVD